MTQWNQQCVAFFLVVDFWYAWGWSSLKQKSSKFRGDVCFWICNRVCMVTVLVYCLSMYRVCMVCHWKRYLRYIISMYKCMHTMTTQLTGSVETCLELCQKCLLKNLWLYFCIWDFCQSTISGDCCELWLAMKRTRSAFWTICDYISAFGTSVRAIQVSILFLDFFDMLSLAMKITRSAFWRTCDYISAFGTSVRALYLQTLLISPLILSIFAVRQR